MMTPELQARCSSGSEEGVGIPVPAPILDRWAQEWSIIPGGCEPDLSAEDITNGRLARIIEETRISRVLELQAKKESVTGELGALKSQVRAQMNRDGVARMIIAGVGKAELREGRPLHECDNCLAAIGEAKRDPYLKVEAAK